MPVGDCDEVRHSGDTRSIDAHFAIAWTAEDVGEQRVEAARAGDDAGLEGDGRKLSGHRVRGRAQLDPGRTGDATIEWTEEGQPRQLVGELAPGIGWPEHHDATHA